MADYISKEAVIKKISEVQNKATTGTEDVAYYRAIKIIRDEPVADVQPVKHGRWENEYLEDDDVWWAHCTNCKNDSHSRYGRVSIYAYCPNCGARMIKGGKQNG